MESKLFKKLNDAVEIVKIENATITEDERKEVEKKIVFENSNAELIDSLKLEDSLEIEEK